MYNYYKCLAKKGEHLQGMLFVVSANISKCIPHKMCERIVSPSTGYILDVCSLKCSIQYCYIIKLSHYDLCYSTWCVLLLFSKATRYGGCGVIIIIIIISGVQQKKRLEFENELRNEILMLSWIEQSFLLHRKELKSFVESIISYTLYASGMRKNVCIFGDWKERLNFHLAWKWYYSKKNIGETYL